MELCTGCDFFDNWQYAGGFSTKVWLVQLIDRLHRYEPLLTYMIYLHQDILNEP